MNINNNLAGQPLNKMPIDYLAHTASHLPLMESTVRPIQIAILGFNDDYEQLRMNSLFAHAKRWQQPWEIVSEPEKADFLLVAADAAQDLTSWLGFQDRFYHDHIIAYTNYNFEQTRWFLKRPFGGAAPSALEFTILLKEISKTWAKTPPARTPKNSVNDDTLQVNVSKKKPFDWRERLKVLIVGSVGSGKTTAIKTLSDGDVVSTEAAPSDHNQHLKKTTTVAMDFGTLNLSNETQLLVYGAPGQRRFDFMSGILIKNSLGIIILVNNENSNVLTELNYYLDTHKEFLRNNYAVIGVTHNDLKPTPSLNEYAKFIEARGESWPVLKVDARSRDDMMKLVNQLLAQTIRLG